MVIYIPIVKVVATLYVTTGKLTNNSCYGSRMYVMELNVCSSKKLTLGEMRKPGLIFNSMRCVYLRDGGVEF